MTARPWCSDRGGTGTTENMESVMINYVTEKFGISGGHEGRQPTDDGEGDDGRGSVKISLS